VVRLPGARVDDREVHGQGLLDAEWIDERGADIRDQLHVGFRNSSETADRGPVEELAIHEEVGIYGLGWHVEVLLNTWQVGEANVNELDVLFGNVGQSFFWTLKHVQVTPW